MSRQLHLGTRADGSRFSLDLDVAVERQLGVLGTKGGGKTYAALVLAEEVLSHGIQVCALDPTGTWSGLRSDAAGTGPGYPITILGGAHGDLALEPSAGAVVADAVADGLSCILDLSEFNSLKDQRTFATAFAERLYKAKSAETRRSTLLLEIDEADEFAPQRTYDEVARMQRAFEVLVKRGRSRGIWVAAITQRPAALHTDVRSQCHALLALNTIGKHDRKAIDDWVDVQGTAEQRATLSATIADLAVGEGWWCSPRDRVFERIRIRRRHTFDSSATPKPGERRSEPEQRAQIDLDALQARMAETVEQLRQHDPSVLRQRITQLERELAAAHTQQAPEKVTVPVPVFDSATADSARHLLGSVRDLLRGADEDVRRADDVLRQAAAAAPALSSAAVPPAAAPARDEAPATPVRQPARARGAAAPAQSESSPAPSSNGRVVTPSEQRILDALLWWEVVGVAAPTRRQVGFVARYTASGGRFTNLLGAMRSAGLLAYPTGGTLSLTPQGRKHAVRPRAVPDTAGLHDLVLGQLTTSQQRVLTVLLSAYPEALTREELGARTGYEPRGGRYTNLLGELRGLSLVEYPDRGSVRASDLLFLRSPAGV